MLANLAGASAASLTPLPVGDLAALCLVTRNVRFAASRSDTRGKSASKAANVLEETLSAAMVAAQAGDARAYRALLQGCMPVIAVTARAQGVRGAAVEDAVQETLLTVHRARASYDPARPFLPWLRAIAKRRAIDIVRRESRRPVETHDPLAYERRADADSPAPGDGLDARERDACLFGAVAALPEGQRQAVEHLALNERSLAETAALTGRSKGALKVNLHRALKALRGALSESRRDGDV